jgi:hypothetical protein
MATNAHRDVREWLDAELAGRAEDADRRFRAVAGSLPRLDPPARFADAVMARVGAMRAVPDLWARWWVRAAVAACVLSAGGAGLSLSPQGWFMAILASLRAVALGFGDLSSALHAWVTGAVALWAGLAHAAVVVGRQIAGPAPLLILLVNFAMAAGALAALSRLMPSQEN